MNGNSDWTAVHEQMLAEARQKLGAPPTAEELLAYSRGELPPDEEERVRALLVCYPDLARTLLCPGEDEIVPELTQEQIAADWKSLQKKIHGTRSDDRGGNVLPFWRFSAAIAATLAVVFGGLLWRARSELAEPRVPVEYSLQPEGGVRGGGDPSEAITIGGNVVLFVGRIGEDRGFDQFKAELADAAKPGRRLWISAPFRVDGADHFSIFVPANRLERGRRYRVVLYGVDGTREERLETYSILISR